MPKDTYWLFSATDDGVYCHKLTKEMLENEGGLNIIDDPPQNMQEWHGDFIIKGEIVKPTPKKTVTEWDID